MYVCIDWNCLCFICLVSRTCRHQDEPKLETESQHCNLEGQSYVSHTFGRRSDISLTLLPIPSLHWKDNQWSFHTNWNGLYVNVLRSKRALRLLCPGNGQWSHYSLTMVTSNLNYFEKLPQLCWLQSHVWLSQAEKKRNNWVSMTVMWSLNEAVQWSNILPEEPGSQTERCRSVRPHRIQSCLMDPWGSRRRWVFFLFLWSWFFKRKVKRSYLFCLLKNTFLSPSNPAVDLEWASLFEFKSSLFLSPIFRHKDHSICVLQK